MEVARLNETFPQAELRRLEQAEREAAHRAAETPEQSQARCQLLAIGSRALRDVHWLMAQSPSEINDWMTAISNTLPPPPHLPLDDKRLSLTPQQQQDILSSKPMYSPNNNYQNIQNDKPYNPSQDIDIPGISTGRIIAARVKE
ncbi:hypothetical protein JTB14_032944 [Gonioctena quinquepunctata]|nr:hypothetical protein JTB14_032944 [Gonioctena quinquepunctata]